MKRIISFCLWGDRPKYAFGALQNAELAKRIYPGWITRYYVGSSIPLAVSGQLQDAGAEVVNMNEPGDWRSSFWRFHPAGEADVEVILSRDTDSRLSLREKTAVDAWLATGKAFHIMRDHPWHNFEILAGMWGARRELLTEIYALAEQYSKDDYYQVDQDFLRERIYPLVKGNCVVHDEFFECEPFPTPRINYEFVGDVFDEHNVRNPDYWRILASFESNRSLSLSPSWSSMNRPISSRCQALLSKISKYR